MHLYRSSVSLNVDLKRFIAMNSIDMDESSEVEKAKYFWSQVDVDLAFEDLQRFLLNVRDSIKSKTASDKEYVQAMNIILEADVTLSTALKNVEEVFLSEDIVAVSVTDSHCTLMKLKDGPLSEDILHEDSSRGSRNPESGSENSQMSSSNKNEGVSSGRFDQYDNMVLLSPRLSPEDQLAPMSPGPMSYQQHDCSPSCLSNVHSNVNHFLGYNPLRVPLLCHFQRQCVVLRSVAEQEVELLGEEPDSVEVDVLYKAPCGRGLCCMEDVLQFLQQTKILGILQPLNFSFNPQVVPDRQSQPRLGSTPSLSPTILFERDISRGTEAVPVPLCNEVDGVRPKEFRYRKDRWPHGCFLSAAPFFSSCCDCTDGCTDRWSCTCLQLSLKAGADPNQLYSHQRLSEPVSTGLYECGPWCGCEKTKCLNRVVQRGLRVRLQVFRTPDKGWGVRCRDDLDKGTFVCTYAGVVLSLGRSLEEPLPSKSSKEDPVSDDEVEVVEEWTLPSGLKNPVTEDLETSPPLYVPVIQRPADQPSMMLDEEKEPQEQQDLQKESKTASPDSKKTDKKGQDDKEEMARKKPRLDGKDENRDDITSDQTVPKGDRQKQGYQEQIYYLDASKEGNVARFINHSCNPNLFVQNVFVDTHDPKFPIVAFFTCCSIKAGTELTWNYCYKPGSDPEHEVPCLCGYKNCQTVLI